MNILKSRVLKIVTVAACLVALALGIVFALPVRSASADEEFTPVGTEAELTGAVSGAQAGVETKIQLTQDIALNAGLTVDGNRNIVLDLNGHKLSHANYSWVVFCQVGTKLTLIDTKGGGVITNEKQWSGQPLIYNYGELITSVDIIVPGQDNYGSPTYGNSPAINSASTSVSFATQHWNKPSLTIKGGRLQGPQQGAIINLVDSNLTVEGGIFVPYTPGPDATDHNQTTRKIISVKTLTINAPLGNTTVEAAKEAAKADLDAYKDYRGCNIQVTGGDFTAFTTAFGDFEIDPKIYVGYYPYSGDLSNLVSNGDTGETTEIAVSLDGESKWGKDLSAYTPADKWMELYDPSIDLGSGAEKYYIVSDASEAAAGAAVTVGESTRYYTDFASAFAVIGTTTEDRTLKLCKDVKVEQLDFSKISGNVTFDLNGKKLTIERNNSMSSGHIYFGSSRNTLVSLTVKDSLESGGEIILATPSGGAINTNSFFSIGSHAKFTLESGTIRQTGYFPANYKTTTNASNRAAQAIFHLTSSVEVGAVTIKGGNIISDIYYGTEAQPGELTSSPFLASWEVTTFSKYELNFETGEKYTNKTEIFQFELTDSIEAGKTSAFSWNFKDDGAGAAQWEALGETFNAFTFSGYGKDYLVSNFTEEDNFLGSNGETYGTLQEAVNGKTGSGYSITVLQDNLTVDESVVLDGITLDLDRNRNFTLILGEGVTLALTNGAILRNGTLSGDVTVDGNAKMQDTTVTGDVAVNGGTLIIPSGEYQGGFTVADGAVLDITGGWFKGKAIGTVDQGFAFTLGAYIEAGGEYDDNTLYEVKIAPNLKAQKWYNENRSKAAFEIASTDDWNAFAIYVSSGVDVFQNKTVRLTAKELDFGYRPEGVALFAARDAVQPFIPAGNQTYRFIGTFDGGNNTIKGINVTERNAGLFGGTNGPAKINNITVEDSVFRAGSGYFDVYNTEKGYVFAGGIIAQGNHGHNAENPAKGIKLKNITITQEDGVGNLMGGGFLGQTWSNLYLEGIEIDGITLDGYWKLGGIVGFTEASVTVIGGKVSNYKSLRDGYCVGVVTGHANGGGSGNGTHLTDCTILAEDSALVGSMYSSGKNADFVIDGPETYIVAEKLVDSNADRTDESKTQINFSSEVEPDGVHRTTVILGKGSDEQKLTLADEEGNELPEEQKPQFDEDGGLVARTPLTDENRIDVSIGALTGTMTYAGSGELTLTVDSFDLFDKFGNPVDKNLYGEIIIQVTLKESAYNVGKQVALIASYTVDGADAANFNFLAVGNQAFIEIDVTPATLYVSIDETGRVSYDGFVGGEDESVLGGKLVMTYDENGAVHLSGLESSNYNIVYRDGVILNQTGADLTTLWIVLGTVAAVIAVASVAVIIAKKRKKN